MKLLPWSRIDATVTLSENRGRETLESEVRVRTLEELFAVCRDAPPARVVRVSIAGPQGEVRLHFASYQRKA